MYTTLNYGTQPTVMQSGGAHVSRSVYATQTAPTVKMPTTSTVIYQTHTQTPRPDYSGAGHHVVKYVTPPTVAATTVKAPRGGAIMRLPPKVKAEKGEVKHTVRTETAPASPAAVAQYHRQLDEYHQQVQKYYADWGRYVQAKQQWDQYYGGGGGSGGSCAGPGGCPDCCGCGPPPPLSYSSPHSPRSYPPPAYQHRPLSHHDSFSSPQTAPSRGGYPPEPRGYPPPQTRPTPGPGRGYSSASGPGPGYGTSPQGYGERRGTTLNGPTNNPMPQSQGVYGGLDAAPPQPPQPPRPPQQPPGPPPGLENFQFPQPQPPLGMPDHIAGDINRPPSPGGPPRESHIVFSMDYNYEDVRVIVESAVIYPSDMSMHQADAYVEVTIEESTQRTSVNRVPHENVYNWNEELRFHVLSENSEVKFQALDKYVAPREPEHLGGGRITLKNFTSGYSRHYMTLRGDCYPVAGGGIPAQGYNSPDNQTNYEPNYAFQPAFQAEANQRLDEIDASAPHVRLLVARSEEGRATIRVESASCGGDDDKEMFVKVKLGNDELETRPRKGKNPEFGENQPFKVTSDDTIYVTLYSKRLIGHNVLGMGEEQLPPAPFNGFVAIPIHPEEKKKILGFIGRH